MKKWTQLNSVLKAPNFTTATSFFKFTHTHQRCSNSRTGSEAGERAAATAQWMSLIQRSSIIGTAQKANVTSLRKWLRCFKTSDNRFQRIWSQQRRKAEAHAISHSLSVMEKSSTVCGWRNMPVMYVVETFTCFKIRDWDLAKKDETETYKYWLELKLDFMCCGPTTYLTVRQDLFCFSKL